MKFTKKKVVVLLFLSICVLHAVHHVNASVYDDFGYKKSDKLYKESNIIKGKKHLTKYTKKGATQYQIVKISKGKITLRPQKGWWFSADPYFKKKTFIYKLSSKCKFYYRDVSYPYLQAEPRYKRVSKRNVLNYMKDKYHKIRLEYIEDAGAKYYTGSYFGEVFVRNGKVVAIITNGGD